MTFPVKQGAVLVFAKTPFVYPSRQIASQASAREKAGRIFARYSSRQVPQRMTVVTYIRHADEAGSLFWMACKDIREALGS